MVHKEIYVITGGPGFGKTALIEELKKKGYTCSGEFARDLIEDQVKCGGNILPWRNVKLFQEEVLKQRIAFFNSVLENTIAFADRAIPDQIAFARYRGFNASEILIKSAAIFRYAHQVFVAPPWPEIYENDKIRTESYEEAILIHQCVLETYHDLNYQIIELPLLPVKERMNYLLTYT